MRYVGFCAVLSACLFLAWDHWAHLFSLWTGTDTYMHGLFVPILVSMMMSQMRPPATDRSPSILFSSMVMIGWSTAYIASTVIMVSTLTQLILIAFIPLLLIAQRGSNWAFHYKTPLILWMFSVPFGDFLIPYLQTVTADMAVLMLQWSGVTVLRNGWYITIPQADFRVAEACSGVNFLISTAVLSVFFAFMHMRVLWKRLLFISLGVIIPVIANGLRVYMIIMIAHFGNIEAATGFDHLVYGWVFFVVILAFLLALGWRLRDLIPTENGKGLLVWMRLSPSVFIVCLLSASLAFFLQYRAPFEQSNSVYENSHLGMSIQGAVLEYHKKSEAGGYYERLRLSHESGSQKIIGYSTRIFDEKLWGLVSVSKTDIVINGEHRPSLHYVLSDLHGKRISVSVTYKVNNAFYNSFFSLKWAQFIGKLNKTDLGGSIDIVVFANEEQNGNLKILTQ